MANEQNLKPLNTRTKSEQREIATKGGKASGVTRRKRKEFKEALKQALTVVMENNKTVQEIGIEALMAKFMAGDPKVFELIRDTIGEKPTEKQEVKVVDSDWFK
jgi:flagellar hook-basal body complex protein FliE